MTTLDRSDGCDRYFYHRSQPGREEPVSSKPACPGGVPHNAPSLDADPGIVPSGHTASVFAFAMALTADCPMLALPSTDRPLPLATAEPATGCAISVRVEGGAALGRLVGTVVQEVALGRPRRLERGGNKQRKLTDLRDAHGAGPRQAVVWNSGRNRSS